MSFYLSDGGFERYLLEEGQVIHINLVKVVVKKHK